MSHLPDLAKRRFVWLAALLLCIGLGSLAGASPEEAPRPVPDAAARKKVTTALRKQYRDEFRSKDRVVLRTLAKRLRDEAAGAAEDPARRYALLAEAAKLAQGAADVRLALSCVDRMAASFDVDAAALAYKAVHAISKSSKEGGVLAESASACIDIAGDALASEDGATAGKAISAASKLSKKAKLDGLAARASALSKLVSAYKKSASAAARARTALAENPDDPDAHAVIGRHLCFGAARWEAGFDHLAQAVDGPLTALVALERSDTPDRVALGNAWWELAQGEKDVLARARMLARAAEHDRAAGDGLPEADAVAIAKRGGEITYTAWGDGVALTQDFSKYGPANLALATIRSFIERENVDRTSSSWRTSLPRFPELSFGDGVEYRWHLETNQGPITLRLFHDTAPQHVANFLYLTELGFFDGLLFHRVIPDFMAQGGCPTGSGSGDPGYTIDGEYGGGRKHDKAGILSMANTGQPKTDGSQFFITFRPTPNLDGKHTVFGEVLEGMDAVRKLEQLGTAGGRPKSQLRIESARVSVH